ncbi:MAG: hypothetical protein ACXV2D_02015 [Halobacteriota archaeon]
MRGLYTRGVDTITPTEVAPNEIVDRLKQRNKRIGHDLSHPHARRGPPADESYQPIDLLRASPDQVQAL